MEHTRRNLLIADALLLVIFVALPVIGLVSGPAYAAMIFGLGVLRLALSRGADFTFDPVLTALAAAFALWCWASVSWSVMPHRTVSGALQATAVMAGALVFFSVSRRVSASVSRLLLPAMTVAFVLGTALIAYDASIGYGLHGTLGIGIATKFNRGVLYSTLLAGPVLAYWVGRRAWGKTAILAVALAVTILVSYCTTAKVAVPFAILVAVLAWWRPVMTRRLLAAAITLMAVTLPWLLQGVETFRTQLVPYMKPSAMARLEIWDYTTAHVLERPFLGWGFQVSNALPVPPDRLATYRDIHFAYYPHNQWLELWVDVGPVGALIALVLVWVVLRRIGRLSTRLQPFALAVFTIAMTISCTDFKVDTDSWWAALAATAFLFRFVDRDAAA